MLVPHAGADETERLPPRNARLHLNAALIVSLSLVLGVIVIAHLRLEQRYDFGVFYFATHMLLDGARHSLYDLSAQHAFQTLYHRPPEMTFRNPAVALLPLIPLARFPQTVAYCLWTIASFALLFVSLKVLQNQTRAHFGNWPLLLAPAFVPVLASLLHGQFSLLILASFSLTYTLWMRGHRALGGLILSVAMIKFQLVVGLIAILVCKRKGRELTGLACGSLILLAISAWMVGPQALLAYPRFLIQSEPVVELPHMADWHGLLAIAGITNHMLLPMLCVATIGWAAAAWQDLDRGFAAGTLAAILVSYHLVTQDLSLLIIPFYLCMRAGILSRSKAPAFAIATIIGLFVLAMIRAPFALLAMPLTCALLWIGGPVRSPQTDAQESPIASAA